MLVQNFNHGVTTNNYRPKLETAKNVSSFQPAASQDLVDIGRGVNEQDRFLMGFGPIGKVMFGGLGTAIGAVGGGIAWAAGASGWALPVATVGCGLIGTAIGHFAVDR